MSLCQFAIDGRLVVAGVWNSIEAAPEMLKVNIKGEAMTPQKGGKNEAVDLGFGIKLQNPVFYGNVA